MARAQRKAGKSSAISVDFSDTEGSGVIPEIDVILEVDEVERKTSDNSGADYLAITLKVDQPAEYKNRKVWHNCSLQPQALFNLRGLLEALGFEVPTGVMELDPADMIGEKCGASIVHEEYQGKTKARVGEFFPVTKKAPAPTPAPVPAKKVVKKKGGGLAVDSNVTFTDDEGNEQKGRITALDGTTATVLVGEDEWELETTELTLA